MPATLLCYTSVDTWRAVYLELKNQGYTLVQISQFIGKDFKNQLYKSRGMHADAFAKLQNLISFDIPHTTSKRRVVNTSYREIQLRRTTATAEFIGIMLGDGYVGSNYIAITLNEVDETEYVEYTKLLMEQVLGVPPFMHKLKGTKGVQLRTAYRGVINELIRLGLQSGNKTHNQVGVPEWIRRNTKFQIACIRGLTDTDGSIFLRKVKSYRYINIKFTNHSQPLLDFFQQFCEEYEIKICRREYSVNIQAQKSVKRFIKTVQPYKARIFKK